MNNQYRITLVILALTLILPRCTKTPPKKVFEPPVIRVGYAALKFRIDSARAESEAVAVKMNREIEQIKQIKAKRKPKQIYYVRPFDHGE